jgi:hypothetical protein
MTATTLINTGARLTRSVCLALLVLGAVGCKKLNGDYCDATTPCKSGRSCDLLTRQCGDGQVVPGADMAFSCAQCSGTTPLCTAASCGSCQSAPDPQSACAAATPLAPFCLASGACAGCRTDSDCSRADRPICDSSAHDCRACAADAECPSGVCDLVPTSVTHGSCIDAGQVVYVDVNSTSLGNGLTATTPLGTITDGIVTAASVPRPFVHVAGGTYLESVQVSGRNVFVVGNPGTVIVKSNGNKSGFVVSGNSTLGLRGLVISAPSFGIDCEGAGATSIVNAYQTQFLNNGNDGVLSNSCTLTLDGCWSNGNAGAGVRVSGSFTVVNSVMTHNSAGGFAQNSPGSTMYFTNNTVADNNAGIYAGISCVTGGNFPIVNSIVYNNTANGMLSEFDTVCTSFEGLATDDPTNAVTAAVDLTKRTPGFAATMPLTAQSYALTAGSPCLDQGVATGAPSYDYLSAPRPDAKTKKYDIGAFELQYP